MKMPIVVQPSPPWMDTAKLLIGTKETIGKSDNPTIMKWARTHKPNG
jgi:hypothetical protein